MIVGLFIEGTFNRELSNCILWVKHDNGNYQRVYSLKRNEEVPKGFTLLKSNNYCSLWLATHYLTENSKPSGELPLHSIRNVRLV